MSSKLHSKLTIQTPEGIRFSYFLASPVSRFLAWFIDLMVIITLVIFLRKVLFLLSVISFDLFQAAGILAYFIISIGYGIIMEWLRQGQTIGKKVLRLQVIDGTGLQLQFTQVFIRNLFRPVDSFPLLYCFGGIVCLFNKKCRRLGDIAAGTVVIRFPRISQPHIIDAVGDKFNSFRKSAHICAILQQRVPHELAFVALQSLLRRNQFDSDARVVLFDDIARSLKSYAVFPEYDQIGLSSEQYVRNCVDILYNNKKP